MGRLADARRRARRGAPAPEPAQPEHPLPEPPAVIDPPASVESDAVPVEPDVAPAAPDFASGGVDAAAETAPETDTTSALESQPTGAGARDEATATPPEAVTEATAAHEADAADDLVFPDDAARLPARYVLPSSGLADEILAAAVSELSAGGDSAPVEAAPEPAAAGRAHQFTFFAAPEREVREQVEQTEHLVTFTVGDEEYGVDVRLVQEIIRVPAVTAVPRAPDFVRGVINLRGRIIPVIDLKTKLGLGRVDAAARRARVLVVRLKGRLVGLLVDGASQVVKVPLSLIEAAPEEVVEIESHFLRGVAKLDSRLIILVDLLEVLAPELRAEGAAP